MIKVEFMRECFNIMKEMALELKYMQILMYLLENFKTIKSMAEDNFIGLISLLLSNKMQNLFNFIKVLGGEVSQMEVGPIKKVMGMSMMVLLKMA